MGNSYHIYEIYHPRIRAETIFETYFAAWTSEKGLEVTEQNFYRRRMNFNGTILYIGTEGRVSNKY